MEIPQIQKAALKTDPVLCSLCQFPSREELTEAAKVALKVTMPSADVAGLDAKSLLALVKKEDVQRAIAEKTMELAQMKTMLEKR